MSVFCHRGYRRHGNVHRHTHTHTHTYIFWGTFLCRRPYRSTVKPGRCTVDTGTITLCLLCTPVCVCVCMWALALTDFCFFSQALPIRERSTPSLQLSQLFHFPLFSLWKKSLLFTETDGDVDDHHKRRLTTTKRRCLCLCAGFMMPATLFGIWTLNCLLSFRSLCLAMCSAVREALF